MRNARVLQVLLLSALTGIPIAWAAAAQPTNVAGRVTAVAGPVTVTRAEVSTHPLKFRDDLYWRDVVEARKDGIARVLLGGKTTVTVRELSRLELREERLTEGTRYAVELMSGKVRASVARMLMRPGDQVEVRTRNAVASVRGTDFIVETVERPAQGRVFGLLGAAQVAQAVAEGGGLTGETVVVTLAGVVEVMNRLAGTGQVERVGVYEAVRVSGLGDPLRFQVRADDLRNILQGLTPPRPQEARSSDKAELVASRVERVALAASTGRVFDHAGGDGGSLRKTQDEPASQGNGTGPAPANNKAQASGNDQPNISQSNSQSTSSNTNTPGNGQVNGNGQGNAQAPATPAAPAIPATPATPAIPAVATTPAAPPAATPPASVAASSVPAASAAPAIPATPAVPATLGNSGKGQSVSQDIGKGNSGLPPGQAKK